MSTVNKALTRFLLPLDVEGAHARPVALMRCLAETLKQRIEKITLLHVMAGRYLSQHMANVDFRTTQIISSDRFQELRQTYIDKEIRPILENVRQELADAGISAPIDIVIEDGDPVDRIAKLAEEGEYSSLILQRSDKSAVEEMFIGSVTSGVLHRDIKSTIYLAGSGPLHCPPRSALVALDESENARAALERAMVLAEAAGQVFEKMVLVHVMDAAECSVALANGSEPEKPGSGLLDEAEAMVREKGLASGQIVRRLTFGDPADVLVQEVEDQKPEFVFMGRRGRSALKELFMGSVSSKVISRCTGPAITLVSA